MLAALLGCELQGGWTDPEEFSNQRSHSSGILERKNWLMLSLLMWCPTLTVSPIPRDLNANPSIWSWDFLRQTRRFWPLMQNKNYWLVVSNMTFFPYYMGSSMIILPIDELIFFKIVKSTKQKLTVFGLRLTWSKAMWPCCTPCRKAFADGGYTVEVSPWFGDPDGRCWSL